MTAVNHGTDHYLADYRQNALLLYLRLHPKKQERKTYKQQDFYRHCLHRVLYSFTCTCGCTRTVLKMHEENTKKIIKIRVKVPVH